MVAIPTSGSWRLTGYKSMIDELSSRLATLKEDLAGMRGYL